MISRAGAIVLVLLSVSLLHAGSTARGQAPADAPAAPSFRNEVMAVLSKSGCNLGTCHGNQHGKGGLKLSLRGQDPEADYLTLTRQLAGRRTNILLPDNSLLLQKPSMQIPHEGGRRFGLDSPEYQLLRVWIAGGLPADSDSAPRLMALKVSPQHVTLHGAERIAALRALATFSDGTERDITSLAVFESSDPAVTITRNGEVQFAESTESRQTSVTVRYLDHQTTARCESVPDRPGFVFTAPASNGPLDDLVFASLQRLQINPAPLCDDVTFLRRVYLDVTGRLPPADRAKEFLASAAPAKRAALIDELLSSTEYVDAQTLRWADLLRVEDKTLDPKGVQVFHQWIRESVAADQPLNQFVADIIAARGSTYIEGPANFYRALRTPEERSESAAQVFLGVRLQCAKCHNHPFDRWTQDDYYGWTNYFAHVDYKIIENRRRDENDKHEFDGEQIVFMKADGNVRNPTTGKVAGLRFLGDAPDQHSPADSDRLHTLAAWLSAPGNHRFAATQANRIWFQVMGRGIVDPIDDFRATNPPSSPELLDFITREFVAGHYRVRPLMRLILNSTTYQLSSQTNPTNTADESLFSHIVPRRLTAEQTLDAITSALDTDAPFGGHPDGVRAGQLTGVRNGGHRYSRPESGDRFLAMFGKPSRLQTCECERTGDTSLAQTMELVAGELITQLLSRDDNRIARAMHSDATDAVLIADLYWSALSRNPTDTELQQLSNHVLAAPDRATALRDIAWAVLNSNEFLLRR